METKTATEGMTRQITGSIVVNLEAGRIEFDKGQFAVGNPKRLAAAIAELINNGLQLVYLGTPVIDLDSPNIPDGLELLPEDKQIKSRLTGRWTYAPDQLFDHLDEGQKNGGMMVGDNLRSNLEGQPVQRAALIDFWMGNKHLIPEAYKDGKWRLAWGDIYCDSDGLLCVRGFRWSGEEWYECVDYVGRNFDGDDPAICASGPSVPKAL